MTGFWCQHAWLDGGVRDSVRLVTDGDRLRVVLPDTPAEPTDTRLLGLTLPGFGNAHSHAFHRALRGRTHGGGGDFWAWRDTMYAVATQLDPDSYLALARAAYAEMVLAGYTAVGEFHYVHHTPGGRPYADPNAMGEALQQAAAQAGIRLTLLDTCYLRGGLDGAGHSPLSAAQQRFGDADVHAWAQRAGARRALPGVLLGAAVHSVRAVPAPDLPVVAEAARAGAAGCPIHLHLSEQPAENEACQAYYRRTPTQLLADEGLLEQGVAAVHATHVAASDRVLLGRSGAAVVACPTTERDLADGIGPMGALATAGCALALGSDQHAVVDPFEELRALEMHERLATGRRGRFTPAELLHAATAGGYRALGRGSHALVAGAAADFVTVAADTARTAGARLDQLPYAATAADVRTVVVAGETIVSQGRHRLGDVGQLLTEAIAAVTGRPADHADPTTTPRRRPTE